MAAIPEIIPPWEVERRKKCYQQFINLKCVKSGHENLNADAEDFDISLLDETKMRAHLLDCAAALDLVEKERVRQNKPLILQEGEQPLSAATETALKSIFTTAAKYFLDPSTGPPSNYGMEQLVRAFPDDKKLTDGRGWLPLHWPLVAGNLSEANIKLVCASDPNALQRYHLTGTDKNHMGFTAAHLLCMRDMTSSNMSLLRHFSIINQQSFTMSASYRGVETLPYGFSALHSACCDGEPTEELLKHLLQLDAAQTKKKCSERGLNPLGYLCKSSSCSDRLVNCLLEVDSSAEVVGNGIFGCIKSKNYARMLERVAMLLKANPEAAKYRESNNVNLLHACIRITDIPFQLCVDVMQRILAIHKNAVREVSSLGWLPIHSAARFTTVEVMEFLLGLYPESASVVTTNKSRNLLHLAANDKENTTSVMEDKMRFLCTRYPAMIVQREGDGTTPSHDAIWFKNISVAQILCEIGGQEQIRLPIAHPTNANYPWNGWLPLHGLINCISESLCESLLLKEADCFRMFLRLYPEAAGISAGVGASKKTPYQLAVRKALPPYYHRLLLRAAPNLNPEQLREVNYAERRMAMFLAFKAVTKNVEPLLLASLRSEKKDLVKHVISFL